MIDKNLFLHDLVIVAWLRNEGHYLKEWIDYHLLAGVDHFYLYDHESTDNYNEVIKPYVEAGLVTSKTFPEKANFPWADNDAIKRFKFQCRYMAFINGDEFLYPKSRGGGVVEVVDEILSKDPNAAGLGVNWQCFGSNGQEKADHSRGVLERFTQRAPKEWSNRIRNITVGNIHVKTIANPRAINVSISPHTPIYFAGLYSVNENGKSVRGPFNSPVTTEKIAINHYYTKSREEFFARKSQPRADSLGPQSHLAEDLFNAYDHNEEFDDGILKYRDARAKVYQPPDNSHVNERLLNALMVNLSPTFIEDVQPNFYAGKMETFLTCRAVAAYLKTQLTDTSANFFEEAALKAISKSVAGMSVADIQLLIPELPKLLSLPYPVVKEIRDELIKYIPRTVEQLRLRQWSTLGKDIIELDYLQDLLKLI